MITYQRRRLLLAAYMLVLGGCGDYPEPLTSGGSIQRSPPETEMVKIGDLDGNEYAKLTRFYRLRDIDFYVPHRSGATDAKLIALSKVPLRQLQHISLLGCFAVTDEGVEALRAFPTLKSVVLSGTSITDTSLFRVASMPNISGVSADCKYVSYTGLVYLARSDLITEIDFTCDNLSQDEVLSLIQMFRKVKSCVITDRQQKLDPSIINRTAKDRGISIAVCETGAMED